MNNYAKEVRKAEAKKLLEVIRANATLTVEEEKILSTYLTQDGYKVENIPTVILVKLQASAKDLNLTYVSPSSGRELKFM